MREQESSRHLSSLVKQDLAKLDNGDTRRAAIKSLQLLVEQLDSSTLPRFISLIAESRESEGSRSYAISLYEDVARVHGKLVVPHISKVMGSLVRSSTASGSFPQLQLASAKVTAALARHSIDSNSSRQDAEKVMHEICVPLTDALAGKLEPVAANAATSIHALIETEQWKYAHDEIVHEICQRTTAALSEKSTRTAAHMHLACILASTNSDILSIYGTSLLRSGEDVLKVTSSTWQLRKAAAKLLQSVLTILDKETLETEIHAALHALDSCRLDKMPHVRAAVSDALHTARMLASGSAATHKSLGTAASPVRKSSERNDRSPWSSDDNRGTSPTAYMNGRADSPSAVPKRTSPRAPMSPVRAGTNSSRVVSPNLRAASPTPQQSRGLSRSPVSTSALESVQLHSSRSTTRSKAKRAPIYPPRYSPRSTGTPGTSPASSTTTVEECESPSRRLIIASGRSRGMKVNGNYSEEDDSGYPETYLRPRASLPSGAFKGLSPTGVDMLGYEVQKRFENQDSNKSCTNAVLYGLDNAQQGRLSLPRLKIGGVNSQTGPSSGGSARTDKEKGRDITVAGSEEENCEVFTSGLLIRAQSSPVAGLVAKNGKLKGGERISYESSNPQGHRYNASAHSGVNVDEEKSNSQTTTTHFLPFVPPTRLVRTLSSLSNPESSRGNFFEQEKKLPRGKVVQSIIADATELGGESSSEAGWSVRDNPMASEDSYPSDSSDEDMDHRSKAEDFPRLRKVGSVDSSPREIHMIVSEPKSRRSFDDPSGRSRKPDDVGHICSDGLSNMLHNDELIRTKGCTNWACQHCESNATDRHQDAEAESENPSAKAVQNEEDQGLGRFSPFRMVRRTLRWCANAALGGSLFLVLAAAVTVAVPLVIVGKALNGSREYDGLVPT